MKKLIAILLSLTLLFSFMAMPVSAADKITDTSADVIVGIGSVLGSGTTKSIFATISDAFHNFIATVFGIFGLDCPLCENHDGYGEAGGEAEYTKAELAKIYNDAVNKLKSYRKNLKIEHTTNVKKVELSASSTTAKNAVSAVLDDYLGKDETTLDFSNQSAKISALIPPTGREAQLSGAYVDYIEYYKANDDRRVKFQVAESFCTYNGTTTDAPTSLKEVFECINFGEYDLGSVKVINADITYKNMTFDATIDMNNNLKNLKTSYELTIDAKVKVNGSESQVTLVLNCADEYNVIYP